MVNSFAKALYQVPIIVFFALFVAVLLKQKFAGRVYFRVIFFIPVILAGVIMSYLFNDGVGSVNVFGSIVSSASGGFFSQLYAIHRKYHVEQQRRNIDFPGSIAKRS